MARVIVEESDRGLGGGRVIALGRPRRYHPQRPVPVVAGVALLAELVFDLRPDSARVSGTEGLDEIGEPAVGDPRVGLDRAAVRAGRPDGSHRAALLVAIFGRVIAEGEVLGRAALHGADHN